MIETITALAVIASGFAVPAAIAYVRRHRNAAPAPVLDPQVPARAPEACSATRPHKMAVSDLGTWWFCQNDGCTEMWPADETHHVDLPYDREAVQLVDETEQYLRSAS